MFTVENTSILDMFDSDDETPPASPRTIHRRVHTIQTANSSHEEVNLPAPMEIHPPRTITATIPLPILEPISDRQKLKERWPCIEKTMNNPISRSKARTRENLKQFLLAQLAGREPVQAEPEDWICWIVNWASPRGRCKYGDDTMGISPASAKIFFTLMIKILQEDFQYSVLKEHPFLYKFPREWQKSITKIRLYERKQAGFFSQSDVRLYIHFLSVMVIEGENSDPYYADMARLVLAISILFAGCRLGELLSAKLSQIQFVTVRNEVAVAIKSTGTKSDIQNQRSSPIAFGVLKDKSLCPMILLAAWIKRNQWKIKDCRIIADTDVYLFPLYKKRAHHITTNHFTNKDM